MNSHDQKTLFTALAFVLVVIKEDGAPNDMTTRISQYVGQMEDFCAADNNGLLSIDTPDAADEADRMIERHVRELRQREETRLPEDHETLIRLHDRLQHRKARRNARAFYASAIEEKLADAVLRLLDEEIEAASDPEVA